MCILRLLPGSCDLDLPLGVRPPEQTPQRVPALLPVSSVVAWTSRIVLELGLGKVVMWGMRVDGEGQCAVHLMFFRH